MKECNIDNNTNCNMLCEQEESNDCIMSLQNKEMNNLQNNNINTTCDIDCTNDNSTKLLLEETNSSDIHNTCTNSNDSLVVEHERCKKEVYKFYQYLKSELEKFDYLNDQSPIKHIAHLEIEASKKKEHEQIVADFENKRINSPNPFSFLAELKTFVHDFAIDIQFDN